MEAVLARSTSSLSLLLLLLALPLCISASNPTSAASPIDFIRTSCRTTRYPALCMQCLSSYAPVVHRSHRQLAHAALTVSAVRARAACDFVARLASTARSVKAREGGAVRDCIETMSDSVDRLRQSVRELGRMGRAGSSGFVWHLNNVQTWVSAALTDENTCLDSLSQDPSTTKVRAAIRGKVVDVAQVTSNALALVNRIGSKA